MKRLAFNIKGWRTRFVTKGETLSREEEKEVNSSLFETMKPATEDDFKVRMKKLTKLQSNISFKYLSSKYSLLLVCC